MAGNWSHSLPFPMLGCPLSVYRLFIAQTFRKARAMMLSDVVSLIMTQLWNIPYILVCLVGIVMAVIRWQRHPGVSQLALLGFGLLLSVQLIWATFPFWRMVLGREVFQIPFLFGGVRFVTICLGVVAEGLLIGAIFGWRSSSPPVTTADSQRDGKLAP